MDLLNRADVFVMKFSFPRFFVPGSPTIRQCELLRMELPLSADCEDGGVPPSRQSSSPALTSLWPMMAGQIDRTSKSNGKARRSTRPKYRWSAWHSCVMDRSCCCVYVTWDPWSFALQRSLSDIVVTLWLIKSIGTIQNTGWVKSHEKHNMVEGHLQSLYVLVSLARFPIFPATMAVLIASTLAATNTISPGRQVSTKSCVSSTSIWRGERPACAMFSSWASCKRISWTSMYRAVDRSSVNDLDRQLSPRHDLGMEYWPRSNACVWDAPHFKHAKSAVATRRRFGRALTTWPLIVKSFPTKPVLICIISILGRRCAKRTIICVESRKRSMTETSDSLDNLTIAKAMAQPKTFRASVEKK